MHALLVASSAVVGVAAGAALDPLGQRLADASRAAERRRREERLARRAAAEASRAHDTADETATATRVDDGADGAVAPSPVPDLDAVSTGSPGGTDPAAEDEPVRHLLPEGRSAPRTVGAGLATGALVALTAARYGPHLVLAPLAVFLAMAVTVSVTDLTHRLVPRQLIYGTMVLVVPLLVLVSAHDGRWRSLVGSAIAGAVAFTLFFLLWFFIPKGMGYGDVRLAAAIGVTVGYLSIVHAYLAFLIGFVLGLVMGLVLMVGSPSGRKTRIPFAPALCLGAAIAILWGAPLAHQLFHTGS